MTALTADKRYTEEATLGGVFSPRSFIAPVGAAEKLFLGAMVILDLGVAKEASAGDAKGHFVVAGIANGGLAKGSTSKIVSTTADNTSGAEGDINVEILTGIFGFVNDSTTALNSTHVGRSCYVVDDQTVSADSAQGNRPIAGMFVGLNEKSEAMVVVGRYEQEMANIVCLLAGADLSALQHTAVKINSSGKVVNATNPATEFAIGILLNKPTADQAAFVKVLGIAPAKIGAAGVTAGDTIGVTTAGAVVTNTTAARYLIGHALETGVSGDTKPIFVQPRSTVG